MKNQEAKVLLITSLLLTLVISLKDIFQGRFTTIGLAFIGAILIITANVGAKKIFAKMYNASVRHEFWKWERYGLKPGYRLEKPIPLGIIASLIITLLSSGIIKLPVFLSYETTAHPGSKRKFAGYTFTEMTDWHTASIGASGIIAVLILSFVTYWAPGLHLITQAAAYYAFFNLIPFSKLDGAQIFMGSRPLWTALALISTIFAFASFALPV